MFLHDGMSTSTTWVSFITKPYNMAAGDLSLPYNMATSRYHTIWRPLITSISRARQTYSPHVVETVVATFSKSVIILSPNRHYWTKKTHIFSINIIFTLWYRPMLIKQVHTNMFGWNLWFYMKIFSINNLLLTTAKVFMCFSFIYLETEFMIQRNCWFSCTTWYARFKL